MTASFVPSGENGSDSTRSREPDQPADELGAVGLPQQDLVEAGDGQERAVGREVERRDHRRPRVDRRMLHVDRACAVCGCVVHGALGDPAADQLDLRRRRAAACPAASPPCRPAGVICREDGSRRACPGRSPAEPLSPPLSIWSKAVIT